MPNEISDGGGSLPEIFDKVGGRFGANPVDDILFSVLLAPPGSRIIHDIRRNFTYLNLRSGTEWDLFLAGYSPGFAARKGPRRIASFNPFAFHDTVSNIQFDHQRALKYAEDKPPGLEPWKYSGAVEMVSFMAYRADFLPPNVDMLSMRSAIIGEGGAVRSIGEVVEKMSDWRKGDAEIEDLAPGELIVPNRLFSVMPTLSFLATSITGGVVGNAAYDLLRKMIS